MGTDIPKVSRCHQIDIIHGFVADSSFVEMKNKRVLIEKQGNSGASLEKRNVSTHLTGFLRDLEDEQRWKYDELPPVQLLEKSLLDEHLADKDELARAEFFWRRRPRLLSATGFLLWIILALGLPFWLFTVPALGVPLLIIALVVVNTGTVRSVRWRRQYEVSIDRLIRHLGRNEQSTASI
jgi:hypothetical protein